MWISMVYLCLNTEAGERHGSWCGLGRGATRVYISDGATTIKNEVQKPLCPGAAFLVRGAAFSVQVTVLVSNVM